MAKHIVEFRQGYIKMSWTRENQDGTVDHEEGGWVDNSETGRLHAAICSCGQQAVGWSRTEALKNLACSKEAL